MTHLMAENGYALAKGMPDEATLIAWSMGPAQLLDYDASVTGRGVANEPCSDCCQSAGIPVVGRVQDVVSRVNKFDAIIVSANRNQVLIRPDETAQIAFEESVGALEKQRQRHATLNQ